MKEKLSKIQVEALGQINSPDANLEEIKIKYLGKKGQLTAVLRGMGALSPEERPIVGQLANEVREAIEAALNAKKTEQQAKALARLSRGDVDIIVGTHRLLSKDVKFHILLLLLLRYIFCTFLSPSNFQFLLFSFVFFFSCYCSQEYQEFL